MDGGEQCSVDHDHEWRKRERSGDGELQCGGQRRKCEEWDGDDRRADDDGESGGDGGVQLHDQSGVEGISEGRRDGDDNGDGAGRMWMDGGEQCSVDHDHEWRKRERERSGDVHGGADDGAVEDGDDHGGGEDAHGEAVVTEGDGRLLGGRGRAV